MVYFFHPHSHSHSHSQLSQDLGPSLRHLHHHQIHHWKISSKYKQMQSPNSNRDALEALEEESDISSISSSKLEDNSNGTPVSDIGHKSMVSRVLAT